jgi:small GTP-binding protein
MSRVLAPERQDQLDRARHLLAELQDALVRFGASDADQHALTTSIRQLEEIFLLVVVGEFNSGKSAFINALVGDTVLQEGVTPTTAQIHLLKNGDKAAPPSTTGGIRIITAPSDLLEDVHIVDTPGTNAIIREHERLTTDFIPRADVVLFVTSAERPFTETERVFIASIRDWGKKIVIIINKVDIFERYEDLEEVRAFVAEAARSLLGITPEILSVSARLAQRAKHGNPNLWAASGFEPLERFIRETLDERNRFRLKLANPLGVSHAIADRYASIARQRLQLLKSDVAQLEDIERQLEVYRGDLRAGFELRMTAVEKPLVEMQARGHAFFEDTLRVGRLFDLMNRARVQKEFEDRVVVDAPQQIERRVMDMIDWLVDQDFRQWQAITARLVERSREHKDRMLGAPGVAAVGLGTLVTIAVSTAAADVTGLVMAGVIATLGLLVIPARRRKAKREMQLKVTELRHRLTTALRTEFERAQEQSATRIAHAVDPYRRFVRAEDNRWREAMTRLSALRDDAGAFRRDLAA